MELFANGFGLGRRADIEMAKRQHQDGRISRVGAVAQALMCISCCVRLALSVDAEGEVIVNSR